MGVAGWRGGTTDLYPGQQKPSRRHWLSPPHGPHEPVWTIVVRNLLFMVRVRAGVSVRVRVSVMAI